MPNLTLFIYAVSFLVLLIGRLERKGKVKVEINKLENTSSVKNDGLLLFLCARSLPCYTCFLQLGRADLLQWRLLLQSRALGCALSGCGTRAESPPSMWNLPNSGIYFLFYFLMKQSILFKFSKMCSQYANCSKMFYLYMIVLIFHLLL